MKRAPVPALLLLFLAAGPAWSQESPEKVEMELYRAVKEGPPPGRVLEMAGEAVKRFPERPYPLVILGDTFFRIRKLGSAERAYRKALALMGEKGKKSPLGEQAARSLALLEKERAALLEGLALEKKARWAGRAVLALLAGLILFLALPGREE